MSERFEQEGAEEVGTCRLCAQRFATQAELAEHVKDAHEGEGLPVPDPRA
jgi:hypothetical protein